MTAHVLVSLLQGQEAQHVIIDTEVPVVRPPSPHFKSWLQCIDFES